MSQQFNCPACNAPIPLTLIASAMGKLATGDKKKRGDKTYYQEIAKKSHQARRAKRAKTI